MKRSEEKQKKERKMLVTWNYRTDYQSGDREFHITPCPPYYARGMVTTALRSVAFSEEGEK